MLGPTAALYGAGLSQDTCLITGASRLLDSWKNVLNLLRVLFGTDGRFSGASHGFCIGEVELAFIDYREQHP